MRMVWLFLVLLFRGSGFGARDSGIPNPDPRAPNPGRGQGGRVEVVPHDDQRRVDVTVDGKPFTAYIYPTTLKKPTLYPLRTASGTVVTRGWPLEPRPGERVDHPHHVGLWFTYSDVNGLDFWNNSDAIPAARAPKMGTIVHRAVRRGGHARRGPDHDTHGAQPTRDLHGREGRAPRASGGPRARATLPDGGGIYRRERPRDHRTDAEQRRRHRPLQELRGPRGRLGVGHARPLDDAVRGGGRGAGHARNSGPSQERRIPDFLARARLRPV